MSGLLAEAGLFVRQGCRLQDCGQHDQGKGGYILSAVVAIPGPV